MSVYVDPLMSHGGSSKFQWPKSCHMYADDLEELHEFAKKIGLKRQWFQGESRLDHYDLNSSRRSVAVSMGAIETDRRHVVKYMRPRKT